MAATWWSRQLVANGVDFKVSELPSTDLYANPGLYDGLCSNQLNTIKLPAHCLSGMVNV